MQSVLLTDAQITLIAAALHAVSPSGGGSAQYTLARKFSALAQDEGEVEMQTLAFIDNAARESADA